MPPADMTTPCQPVSFYPVPRMISIDEDEVHRHTRLDLRMKGRITAKHLHPNHCASATLAHLAMRDTTVPTGAQNSPKTSAIWINRNHDTLVMHYLAEAERVCAVIDADFNKSRLVCGESGE